MEEETAKRIADSLEKIQKTLASMMVMFDAWSEINEKTGKPWALSVNRYRGDD